MIPAAVDAIARILRQSKSPANVMRKIHARVPAATASDVTEAIGIDGGVPLDHADRDRRRPR